MTVRADLAVEAARHESRRLRLGDDAIVEVTETGSSLKANKLRIVETLSGLQSGVDDAMVGGGPWPDLHDHERAAVAAAAALVGNVPTR